jgi:hypothetical protein
VARGPEEEISGLMATQAMRFICSTESSGMQASHAGSSDEGGGLRQLFIIAEPVIVP